MKDKMVATLGGKGEDGVYTPPDQRVPESYKGHNTSLKKNLLLVLAYQHLTVWTNMDQKQVTI